MQRHRAEQDGKRGPAGHRHATCALGESRRPFREALRADPGGQRERRGHGEQHGPHDGHAADVRHRPQFLGMARRAGGVERPGTMAHADEDPGEHRGRQGGCSRGKEYREVRAGS